jgi:hypothetical protein
MPLPDNDEDEGASDSDDSDKSLLDWGPNRINRITQKQVPPKLRQVVPTQNSVHGRPTPVVTTYNREASTNAKFGTRLLSADPIATRSSGRRNGAITPVLRPTVDETVVKPTIA